jgi:hypothetical protein
MIDPSGIPVIDGDMDALARHAGELVGVGGDVAGTGARVHATWQGLAPVYDAPEAGQLLLATALVQQTTASVGEDGVNAAWYAAEGDYLNASLSAAAMVPFLGWAATGGKFAVKGYKAVHSLDGARAFVRGRPTMVPRHATELPFTPNQKFQVGQRFEWTDAATGKKVRYHAHGADPAQPPTRNAGAGPVHRVRIGNHFLDAAGNKHTKNSLDDSSAAYNPQAANDTHIPYPKDQPPPTGPHVRVFAPNPAGLLGPEDGRE